MGNYGPVLMLLAALRQPAEAWRGLLRRCSLLRGCGRLRRGLGLFLHIGQGIYGLAILAGLLLENRPHAIAEDGRFAGRKVDDKLFAFYLVLLLGQDHFLAGHGDELTFDIVNGVVASRVLLILHAREHDSSAQGMNEFDLSAR